MKKSTLILIAIVYAASVVVISVFGLKAYVFNANVPVTSIVCTNETDEYSTVTVDEDGVKHIEIIFTEPGDLETLTGTMLFLTWQVYPDNASQKTVDFVYKRNLKNCTFVTREDGTYTGQILFSGNILLKLSIVSTDGTKTQTDVIIWVHEPLE